MPRVALKMQIRHFTDDELMLLKNMVKAGTGVNVIATRLDRAEGVIYRKLKQLGIVIQKKPTVTTRLRELEKKVDELTKKLITSSIPF